MQIITDNKHWEAPWEGNGRALKDAVKCTKTIIKNKVRIQILLKHWYIQQYIKILCDCKQPIYIKDADPDLEDMMNHWYQYAHIHLDYVGAMFGQLGMIPLILYNLPREF